uniref:beta-glucosidase n=1 Tax=Kwoniella pini CBS 10737 TaxID=1296096 RepID=A0A1B9I4W8_9TREE|nr:uncharacterized protein I206_03892 [Kwoniella pini CBS 10737]OCF50567.1 hypothetical protein I206_03892 [Kwoniella pini CBS 10737]
MTQKEKLSITQQNNNHPRISEYPALPDLTIQTLNKSFVDVDYNEGLCIEYRWFDKNKIEPAFEFGFDSSYTTFNYSNLSVHPSTTILTKTVAAASDEVFDRLAIITVDVCNSGKVGGIEIPLLYIGSPADGSPLKVLCGFDIIGLDVGAKKNVEFQLSRRDLSFLDTYNESWSSPEGEYKVYVGASNRDIERLVL